MILHATAMMRITTLNAVTVGLVIARQGSVNATMTSKEVAAAECDAPIPVAGMDDASLLKNWLR
jgi:hypothetical protein